MKRGLKLLIIIVFAALLIFCVYNTFISIRTGNQLIEVTVGKQYYSNSNIEAIINIKDSKKNESVASTVKVELLNIYGKKVKGIKETYKINEGETANVSMSLPDSIETGNYNLKITSKSKSGIDTTETAVNIINEKDSNILVSFDKGIYKPGDAVNYRALITSKSNDKPQNIDVTIHIYDGNGNKVYSESTKTSEYGIVSGKFILANEVNSGTYRLVVLTKNKEFSKNFTVNPYIAPKFEVEIISDKDSYIIGETAEITIDSKYFFGEPVTNAQVKGTVKDKEFVGLTNSEGKFITTYKVEEIGKTNIKAEVIDTSNYLIEASKVITGSTDIFEIEVVTEYGDIIKGIDNNIYIFTKKADGTPVKTYTTVTIDKITRQVITDEFGIGRLLLTSSDLSGVLTNTPSIQPYYNYSENVPATSDIYIVAEDMNGDSVKVRKPIDIVENSGVAISTDKVKYNVGEDINIKLNSSVDNIEKNVYVYKSNELIKMVSIDNDEVALNLEDTYGLIDIYTVTKPANNYYSYDYHSYNKFNKKTIFIKPDKFLNIDISTDSNEYKPGDALNISFVTTDNTNTNIDSALLVSILDEAILSLAENDLSIDNIKLALEDIELVEGMTAADLYANIIDDESENALIGILLKQSKSDPNITNNKYNNLDKKDDAKDRAIIAGLLIVGLVILYVSIKSKRFKKISIDLINLIAIFTITNLFFYSFIYYKLDASMPAILVINGIISLIVYVLILYKIRDILFKMIVELAIIPAIPIFCINLLVNYNNFEEYVLIIVALFAPAILSVLIAISRTKELSKSLNTVKNICKIITKIELVYITTALIVDLMGIYDEIATLVVLLIVYGIYNKIFNKGAINKIEEGKVVLNVTGLEMIGGIGLVILIVLIISKIFDSSQDPIIDRGIIGGPVYNGSSWDLEYQMSTSDSTGASSSKGSSVLENMSDSLNSFLNSGNNSSSGDMNQQLQPESSKNEDSNDEEIKTSTVENNVRNVFLESLAFIPELVANGGKAETSIKISDNITTWNIQTIGNTKNGDIGFGSSSIKVFKEFFIDFELPKNLKVTDKISVPVTAYNYTEDDLKIFLDVKETDWTKIDGYTKEITVKSKDTVLVYVPIEILKDGNNTLRIEAKANGFSDIIEKTIEVKPNGFEKTSVVSSGSMESKLSQDVVFNNKLMIDGTANLIVKLYAAPIAQAIEGIESIFRMPTGCFEQTSSSLYPNVVALRYLEQNNLNNNVIKEKALEYISSGYQRLLTFEVRGEKGGYSLYGKSPAEPVLTAYGLMELKDLSEVYDVDKNVLENMKEYLYKQQRSNGSFNLGNASHLGGASSSDTLSLNAYIIWALSEGYPEDNRLDKSIKYLEDNLDKMADSYTLALVANAFANTNNKSSATVIKRLMEKVQINGENAYITSNIRDYYGSYGTSHNIQTTALVSLALTKLNSNTKTNDAFINYLISQRDVYGNWYSTQATVLSLKAIIEYSGNSDISEQEISVKVNAEEQKIVIDKNTIDVYELNFQNIEKENNISINMKKGRVYYEIIQKYYVDYTELATRSAILIDVKQEMKQNAKVNEVVNQKVSVKNMSGDNITNGMIEIDIPQGFSVVEDSLMQLEHKGIIEKYEYSYGKIYVYLRNFAKDSNIDVEVQYRANYPADVTGGSIRVYDYYNPEIEGICLPLDINISE